MHCKCCDQDDARWWKDDYYCHQCKRTITDIIREDKYADKDRHPGSHSPILRKMFPQGLPDGMGRQKLLPLVRLHNEERETKDEL